VKVSSQQAYYYAVNNVHSKYLLSSSYLVSSCASIANACSSSAKVMQHYGRPQDKYRYWKSPHSKWQSILCSHLQLLASLCVCVCVRARACVLVCVHVRACVRLYAFMCVCACVCERLTWLNLPDYNWKHILSIKCEQGPAGRLNRSRLNYLWDLSCARAPKLCVCCPI